ncbi:MAG: hypothetical protein ACR2JB_04620 [Bryobacteraceae bacterium]
MMHFVGLILHSGNDSSASDLNLSIGGLLALLAAPGGITALLLFEKYSSLLRVLRGGPLHIDVYSVSVPDKYFLIVCSMVITSTVVALKWERILPGRQDYLNLAPLPLRLRAIFWANVIAVLLLASIFAVDVNAVSSVLFPLVVMSESGGLRENLQFFRVHVTCVILASAFAFLACFSVMGILMSVLPYRIFRSGSRFVRVAIIVASIGLLCSSFAVPPVLRHLSTTPDSLVRFLPSVWYVALYQCMQGRSNPEFTSLAAMGLEALAIMLVLSVVSMVLSYRRYFVRIPESSDSMQPARRRMGSLSALIDRVVSKSGFQSACYRFSLRVLLRSERHFIVLAAFVGLGLIVASQMVLSLPDVTRTSSQSLPTPEVLAAPLAMAYCLIVGVRFVLELPAELNANWAYRTIVSRQKQNTGATAKKVMLTFLIPLVIIPCLVAYSWICGVRVGFVHAVYVLGLSVVLIDIVLLRFRKIPFACALPAFENHTILIVFVHFIGFLSFTSFASKVVSLALLWPTFLLAAGALLLITWWFLLRRLKRATPDSEMELIYEDAAAKEVQTLDILGVG